MKLHELYEQLDSLGYPVAYGHFKEKQLPPCIVYKVIDTSTFNADDIVLYERLSVDVDLYTADKDLELENKIKNMLRAHEIAWDYSEVYIAESQAYQCSFAIEIEGGL